MKKKFLFMGLVASFCFASCATKTLYSWENYDNTSYNYLKNSDEKSTQALIKTYQKLIEKQKGTRQAVPPGVYADYGFILLQADKIEDGKKMLQKEIELYPESKVFIERILKMF